jgi:hypothetical protein
VDLAYFYGDKNPQLLSVVARIRATSGNWRSRW